MDTGGAAEGAVQVWQQPDRLWRWRWAQQGTDGQEEASLLSHQSFLSEAEAVSSARVAYPGVPLQRPQPTAATRSRSRRYLLLIVSVAAGVLVLRRMRRHGRSGLRFRRGGSTGTR